MEGGVGPAVTHTVDGDDVEAQRGQEGDLVPPTQREVGESVDQENGPPRRHGR